MDRRLAFVALVAVVLAGCSAFSPGQGAATPPETVTPAPVPTGDSANVATPTSTDDLGSFPGVSAGGDVNATELFESHVDYLASRSYTVEWERRAAGGSGPLTREYRRRVSVDDDGTYLRRDELARSDNVTVTYSGADRSYRRVVGAGADGVSEVLLRSKDPPGRRFAEVVSFEVLSFLSEGNTEVDVIDRDGRRYARIFTDHAPQQITETYAEYGVQNFTATLWVAPEGYVRAVHYDFDLVDERTAVEWRYAYSGVGETSVERPSWVPGNGSTAGATDAVTTDPSRVPPSTAAPVEPTGNRSAATPTGNGG